MRINYSKICRQSSRGGAALLLLLLVVVVISVLIFLDPSAIFSEGGSEHPWNEEKRLVRISKEVKKPTEDQPSIEQSWIFKADVKKDGQDRGAIEFVIKEDGRIEGFWEAEYNPEPQITYEVMGSTFKGNIDPTKIYKDENGKDRSKLYLIAKGGFSILEWRDDKGTTRNVMGVIYLTGWLDKEYNAIGEITITSGRRNYRVFNWQAKGGESGINMFEFLKGFSAK